MTPSNEWPSVLVILKIEQRMSKFWKKIPDEYILLKNPDSGVRGKPYILNYKYL